MSLNPSNSSNLEQLALKGLNDCKVLMLVSDDYPISGVWW